MINMNLNDYFEKHEKPVDFSRRTGVPNSSLSFWRYGKRSVPIEKMILIEKETNGLVSRKDLCEDWHKYWPELNGVNSGNSQNDHL